MGSYIFNLETTKIELHFERSEYDALSDEQRSALKSAFLWSRTGSAGPRSRTCGERNESPLN